MTLQRLTRISLLAALCVALRQVFSPFPNVQPISAIFFLLVMFEGYSFAFLVMMITMFVSAFFLGMSLIVFFQIVAFGCLMLIWRISYKWLPLVHHGTFKIVNHSVEVVHDVVHPLAVSCH